MIFRNIKIKMIDKHKYPLLIGNDSYELLDNYLIINYE